MNGDALAGGLELGLHCDVRLAVPAARFGMPVAKIGIVVPYPLLLKLVDLVGPATTSELVFTGEPMTADRAHALAMVNRLVAPENLLAEATRMAETIASNAPLAVRAMKRAILAGRAQRRWEPPEDVLRAFNRSTLEVDKSRRITPAAEWLLDNFYLIEEQIHLARPHLPPGYSRELPRLRRWP